jgi:hypothetical protein
MMKKIIIFILALCSIFSICLAEDAAPAAISNDGKPLITSLPERKATNSLKDVLTEADAVKIQKLVSDMIVDYNQHRQEMTPEAWSEQILKAKLTGFSEKRIQEITKEVANTIKVTSEKQRSLEKAVQDGGSKKSWLDGQFKKYITKAVGATTDTPEESSKNRLSGFSLAGVAWGGKTLSDMEADALRADLLADKDAGLKTAVAMALVLASNDTSITIVGNAQTRLLATIAINSVEEAKTVLRVRNGTISGKDGAIRLADTAMASIVGMLAGFDYKQIGFIAGTAAGTAAGGALEGATGGISLGSITINGALIGAYLGEKIGTKLGNTLNETLDAKMHAKIVTEFEGFIGSTVLTVLNISDVKPAVDQINQGTEEPTIQKADVKNQPPAGAGIFGKAWFYVKEAGGWMADKAGSGWTVVKDFFGSGWLKVKQWI